MNVSDFVKASNNPNCTSVMDHNDATYNCPNDIDYNYLIIKKEINGNGCLIPLEQQIIKEHIPGIQDMTAKSELIQFQMHIK